MSGHTGDTEDSLPGDAGEPALASSPAPMTVPSPTAPQAPEAVGAPPPETVEPPELVQPAVAVQLPVAAEPPQTVQPSQTVQPPAAWVPYGTVPPGPEVPPGPSGAAGPPYAPGPPEAAGEFAQPQAPPGAPPPPANPWAPAPGTVPDQPRMARWRRITVMALLLVIGLGATGAGGALLYLEETRHATPAEANAAGQQELASLWQRMTIGQIFPKTASYATTGGISAKATLIGIAPQSSCAAAADPAVARALTRYGCVAMLRATYADQSGTILATVGIAVMKSTSEAQHILNAIAIQGQSAGEKTGILAVGFPGTAFPGSAREVFGSEVAQGPYLFFYTAGYADGRSTSMQQGNGESITTDLGSGVMNSLSLAFTAPAKPCASKDISC